VKYYLLNNIILECWSFKFQERVSRE